MDSFLREVRNSPGWFAFGMIIIAVALGTVFSIGVFAVHMIYKPDQTGTPQQVYETSCINNAGVPNVSIPVWTCQK